jgi:hypothetical protein
MREEKFYPDVNGWARTFLTRHGIDPRAPVNYMGDDDRIIPDGARDVTLSSIAGLLRKVGFAPNFIRETIRALGTSPDTCESPLEERDIEKIAAHMNERGSQPFDMGETYTITTINSDGPEPPPLQWLIPGVVPDEGITIVYGLPAQGKSWTALDFARVVTSGVDWLDKGKAGKRKVLYIDWERRGKMFTRRLHQLAKAQGIIVDYMEAKKGLIEMVPYISEIVHARGYGFVIMDSLTIALMSADAMLANQVIPAMFSLHEIGVPILALDHQKKTQSNENPANAGAYGSIFKEAVASMVWQAIKIDYQRFTDGYMDYRLHHKKNNFDQSPHDINMRLSFHEDGTVTIDSKASFDTEDQIMATLGEYDEPVSLSTLVATTGKTADNLKLRYLDKLIKLGKVRQVHRGGKGRGDESTYETVAGDDD